MSVKNAQKDYPFIVYDGPRIPRNPALRRVIRKQAMKDVGNARRTGAKNVDGRTSKMAGSRVAFNSTSSSASASDVGATRLDEIVVADCVRSVPLLRANPTQSYEELRAKYNIGVQDLCILTNFNIGQSTIYAMQKNPNLMSTLLGHQTCSYLALVPARYGHKPYLTAVIDCVVAKTHSMLHSPNDYSTAPVMRLYAKALHALQEAVVDDEACKDADLLCAVQMLSLHEFKILDKNSRAAYTRHVDGSVRLIRHRTPSSFGTEYEHTLFLGHVGPALFEALYKNEPCYLAQPEWTSLYKSLAVETTWLTDRSPLTIRIRLQMLHMPGMLILISNLLDHGTQYNEEAALSLELKVRKIHQELLECLATYKAHVLRTSLAKPPDSEISMRRELLGSTVESLCMYKRMLAALCEDERLYLETEVQALAAFLPDLQYQSSSRYAWIYAHLEQDLASIMQASRPEWEEDLIGQSITAKRAATCKRWHMFRGYMHATENNV